MNDTRRLRPSQKPVFVDWRGSRRRAVVIGGTLIGVVLAGWLGLIVTSIVLASWPGSV
ncbi:hypothetical protein [Paractinoplanes bogorensis]|uniref:hypothetical protein n=1 Tax=Paractinoplanes bogorensis TaxID=1610840 RepID=UPI001C053771|nr:hypothetical protein [Actinoplanes bogorensis]